MITMQNRLNSKVAWAAIIALVGFILGNWGLYDYIGLTDETFQRLTDLLLAVLTAFGIFNNPTNPENF
jgi:uncharacterized membrane protein